MTTRRMDLLESRCPLATPKTTTDISVAKRKNLRMIHNNLSALVATVELVATSLKLFFVAGDASK
jgi:hypothetical protein